METDYHRWREELNLWCLYHMDQRATISDVLNTAASIWCKAVEADKAVVERNRDDSN